MSTIAAVFCLGFLCVQILLYINQENNRRYPK